MTRNYIHLLIQIQTEIYLFSVYLFLLFINVNFDKSCVVLLKSKVILSVADSEATKSVETAWLALRDSAITKL